MQLFDGRPMDVVGREDREVRVYDFLDELQIKYSRVDHEKAETMEACKAIDEVLGIQMCKNLFLCNRQKTSFYLLLMPADKPFKTKEFSKQLGVARLSFADEEFMLKYLDIKPGAVSVMGLINDSDCEVTLAIDREVIEKEYVGCHPCVNTSSLKIKTSDLLDKILPTTKHNPIIVDLIGLE